MNLTPQNSEKAKIRPAAWGLGALLLLIIFGAGVTFITQQIRGDGGTPEQAQVSHDTPQNKAENSGDAAAKDKPQSGENQRAATQTPRYSAEELATRFPDPSFIAGPGGPVNSLADITNVHRRIPNDPFAIGAVDAPVVISEFSDFECPYCSRFANNQEKALREYIDAGKVRLEWNDLPVNGADAQRAAEAARAAAAQGKFWEFKSALYTASADVSGHPHNNLDKLVEFAVAAGVPDIERFKADVQSGKYKETLRHASGYAGALGVTGTPSFVVGDKFVGGAQPLEVFTKLIDEQLKAAG